MTNNTPRFEDFLAAAKGNEVIAQHAYELVTDPDFDYDLPGAIAEATDQWLNS